ncbi:MAG: hypothetical protein ACREOU_11985, partial [Candidatus Eiseniibacteriota bacterium]
MSPRSSLVRRSRFFPSIALADTIAGVLALVLAASAGAQASSPAPKTPAPASAGDPAAKAASVTPEQAQEVGRMLDDEVVARTKNKDPREVAQKIAGEYGGNADEILKRKQDAKISWGGVMIAEEIARATGRPVKEIIAQKKSGQGWGKIAKDHGLNLGEVMHSAGDRAEKLGLADKAKMQERYKKWEARQANSGGKNKGKSTNAPGVSSGSSSSGSASKASVSAPAPVTEVPA